MSLRMPWNKHVTITHSIVSSSSEKNALVYDELANVLEGIDQMSKIKSLYDSLMLEISRLFYGEDGVLAIMVVLIRIGIQTPLYFQNWFLV